MVASVWVRTRSTPRVAALMAGLALIANTAVTSRIFGAMVNICVTPTRVATVVMVAVLTRSVQTGVQGEARRTIQLQTPSWIAAQVR